MRRPRMHRRLLGVTLVELMIAITIIALAATGTVYSVNALTRTKLRASAMRICAAARFARHRALTQGRTVRVVLDLDTGSLGIEESTGRVTLGGPGDDEEAPEAIDPWASAQQLVANPDEPTLGASSFGTITDEDGRPLERYMEKPLEGNVRVTLFVSPHETEPRERGRVAFYYFPNGTGERTHVELTDPRDNKVHVELDPLAARGRVENGALDLRRLRDRQPRDPG